MPIYEYQCVACGHKLEAMQKMADEPLKKCPDCNKDSLQKLISAAGFQLKGTGWYATDFRNKGKPEAQSNQETKKETSDKPQSTTDKES
jgi:putative FmdB family regulatory protein